MEKRITIPNINKLLIPLSVFFLGTCSALLFNKRISYWLIGLFAHSIIYNPSPVQLFLIAFLATLENFIFLGSSIETVALFAILFSVGNKAKRYLYTDIKAVTLITLFGLALEVMCVEYSLNRLFPGTLYTLLKLSVTLVGVWIVSLTYRLFDR